MKRIFSLLITLCSLAAFGQYPISSISISMSANPPANTADWATAMPPLMITAQAKLVQGKMDPRVQEGRILFIIKKNGSKFCGSFTQQTAPLANFSTASKSYSGAVAVGLLGNTCVLPPGEYQLCVQFFSSYAPIEALSAEVCKSFTIAEPRQENYSAPSNMMPVNGKVLTKAELNQPVTFRWKPVTPPPLNNDVVYTIKIYEVNKDQQPIQAVNANTPAFVKEVNITQAIWQLPSNKLNPKESKTYAWSVRATNKAGKPYGENNGTSELTTFRTSSAGCGATLTVTKDSCIGPAINGIYKHRICVTYTADNTNSCDILFNHPSNNTTTNFGMSQSGQSNIFCCRTPGTSISNFSTALNSLTSTLAQNASVSFCFDLLVPVSATGVKFTAFGLCDDNSGNFNTADPNDSITLKQCEISCCSDMSKIVTQTTNNYSSFPLIGITLTVGPKPIKKVQMDLVYLKATTNENCPVCKNRWELWGTIFNLGGDWASQLDGFGGASGGLFQGTSHELTWVNNNGVDMYNSPKSLNILALVQINFPAPFTSCCNTDFEYCIRYSFTDTSCVTCDTLICSKFTFGQSPTPVGRTDANSQKRIAVMLEAIKNRYPNILIKGNDKIDKEKKK